MRKQIFSIFLCVVMLVLFVPVTAKGEGITFHQVFIDAGNGVQTEKAIVEGEEIFIEAASFAKYTRFEFDIESSTFVVNR